MKVGNVEIGYGQLTFVIAECCSNIVDHIGYISAAMNHVAESGATAVKCQLYLSEHFPEQERKHKKETEFPREAFRVFVELAHKHNLLAGASVFDVEAIKLCVNDGADFLKLATREFQNDDLLHACLITDLPVFQSYDSNLFPRGLSGTDNVLRLACDPHYPVHTPKVINGWESDDDWGWSSHTPDWLDVCIAVSRGACVIEKHIAFHADDPERGWSLMPDDFSRMVRDIRRVEKMR